MAEEIDRISYTQPQTRTQRNTNDQINPNEISLLNLDTHIFDSIFRFISFHSFDVSCWTPL